MKIISWNINGVRAIVKKEFFEDIAKMDPDIICLQETKAQDKEVAKALVNMPDFHQYYNSAKRRGYAGVALLSKVKPISVTYDMGVEEHDQEGRVLCAEFEEFYLVNVYVPNSGAKLVRLDYRKTWDDDFRAYLENLKKTKPVILCGDLNVAHKAIDLKNDKANYNKTAGYTQVEIDGMDKLLDVGFVDSFRHFYPEEEGKYTFWSYRFKSRERNTGWRIDYFLVSNSFMDKVKSSEILSEFYGSDHCPIELKLAL